MILLNKLRRDFSERIKFFRDAKGWTQHDLAAEAEIKTPTLRGYEQGVRWPDPEEIEGIAKALGVEPAQLFEVERPVTLREAIDVIKSSLAILENPLFRRILKLSPEQLELLEGAVEAIEENGEEEKAEKAKKIK